MIGDDIVSDVRGAQMVGIRGVQVRCGKWRYFFLVHIRSSLICVNRDP